MSQVNTDPHSTRYTSSDVGIALATMFLLMCGIVVSAIGLTKPSSNSARADLLTIGVTVAVAAAILLLQEWYFVKRRLKPTTASLSTTKSELANAETRIAALERRLTTVAATANGSTVQVYDRFADLPIHEVILRARHNIKLFVVSGRHILNPNLRSAIIRKLQDPHDTCRIEVLALDSIDARELVQLRSAMMDMRPGHNYWGDLRNARLYARQITEVDPAHVKFDMRFYAKMPTTFFLLADDRAYVAFLLSKPVAECPVFSLSRESHPDVVETFEAHFKFYWDTSRFYVTAIPIDPASGKFLMVKNRKRGWEWPTGYLEPNEKPEVTARRECLEESGYDLADVCEVDRTPYGIFLVGRALTQVSAPSEREVEAVEFFDTLPAQGALSFPDEYDYFEELLGKARNRVFSP